jgi:hypothetical protein
MSVTALAVDGSRRLTLAVEAAARSCHAARFKGPQDDRLAGLVLGCEFSGRHTRFVIVDELRDSRWRQTLTDLAWWGRNAFLLALFTRRHM